MKKRGFTLIELLAVIVILAVIAIISVPIITDLINKSRYGAFGVTKKNIERAAELYHSKNADDLVWEDNISYVTIGTLKSKKFLSNNVVNTLDSTSINDDTKVLLYRKGRKIDYSLQLYDKQFFDWYQGQMVQASKKEDISLPTTIGDKITIDLDVLMSKGLVDELRLPLELGNRCVGYVEVEKTSDNYEYNAFVDCLQGASTFASHYVSYGGKNVDEFNSVKETSDGGYIAVGRSNSETITKYGNANKGKYDAIIVKFDHQGNVLWSYNFGGTLDDNFNDVVEVSDGYVAVGSTASNDGDIENYLGGVNDSLIVKFNKQGTVTYKRNFGGTNSEGDNFTTILVNDGKIIIGGSAVLSTLDGDYIDAVYTGSFRQYIVVTMDLSSNILSKNFYDPYGYNGLKKIIPTTDGYIMVGSYRTSTLAPIIKIGNDMNIISKHEFSGADSSRGSYTDVVEVNDGYIAVGYFNGVGDDMTGLSKANNGYRDAIIVKYDKTLSNILWKKSFGGSKDDIFHSIVKANENEVIVTGYSKSEDMDMLNKYISKDGYSNAILVKYNVSNGNVVTTRAFGGTNSDVFVNIIKTTDNNYIVAGNTFSSDINLQNFNKGHGDAILVNYDNNLNLIKTFQEPVVIIDKLKKIVPNYGTSLSSYYDKIYTSNNPDVDLKNWCVGYSGNGENNYEYGQCLRPFNDDDLKLLNTIENTPNFKIISAGEHEYIIENEPNKITNWYQLYFRMQGGTTELSNFKVKFSDGYIGSIEQSINDKYLEPLVVVSNALVGAPYDERTYKNLKNILMTNGTISGATYPVFYMNLKPQKQKIVSFIFTSNRDVTGVDRGIAVHELRNFDMSITPTE